MSKSVYCISKHALLTHAIFPHFCEANGPYFEQAVRVMSRTVCEAEQSRNYNLLVRSVIS